MLKLNSQYAKSYFREEPSPAGHSFKKTAILPKERGMPLAQENYPRFNREDDFQRRSYGNKKDSSTYAKTRNLQEKEYNGSNDEDFGQSKYGRPSLQNPLSSYNKSPKLAMEQGFDLRQKSRPNDCSQPEAYSKKSKYEKYDKQEKYEKHEKYEKYEKYEPMSNTSNISATNRTDFVAKHNRRNEEIKSKIGRDGSYNSRSYMDYNPRQPTRNTQFDTKMSYNRDADRDLDSQRYQNRQVRNIEQQESYMERAQKYARKLQFEEDCNNQQLQVNKSQERVSQYRQRFEGRNEEYQIENESKTDRFQGRSFELNQRKKKLFNQIQQTPNRNHSSQLQPGSAQKKRSLIEKSQMLQEKLKKLTSTPTQVYCNQEKTSQFRAQQNRSRPAMNERTPQIDQSSTRSSRYSNVNLNQQTLKQTPKNNESQRPYSRHAEILRTPSPILQSKVQGNQGEALERIMDLNSKINERIQSIISNYAKK